MSDDSKLISEWQEENNETRIYYAFDRRMVTAHRESKDEEAEKLARFLLDKAEIPLLIRARACMVLGCSEAPDYLDMAKEAVRIAELGLSLCTTPGEFENQLVTNCRTVLREAQAAFDAAGRGDTDDEEEQGELVWEREDVTAARAAAAQAASAPGATGVPARPLARSAAAMFKTTAGQQKKTRRMHSGDDPSEDKGYTGWQEYDKRERKWVELGTAKEPMLVDEDDEMLLGPDEPKAAAEEPDEDPDADMLLGPDAPEDDDEMLDDGEVFEGFGDE